MLTRAQEFRVRAWSLLQNQDGRGGYATYLGGLLLLSLATFFVALVAVLLFGGAVAVLVALVQNGRGIDVGVGEVSPGILAFSTIASAILVFSVLYLIGFATWSRTAMSIALVRRGLVVRHAFSGWGNGWRMVSLILWSQTYIFFWSLLLIVPGIRAAFSYAMAPYLLIDHPDWTPRRCIDESKRMMEGERWNYFCLNFSFIGWYLLAIPAMYLIGGFAQMLLTPYVNGACAVFYENLLDRADAAAAKGVQNGNEEAPALEA